MCYNDILFLIMLFCIITILFVCPDIILCLVMLCCIVTLQYYCIIIYASIICRILLYCSLVCNNYFCVFSYIILLFFNVTMLFCIWLNRVVTLYCCFVRYVVVLCIIMLFYNDVTMFHRLQYYGVSNQIIFQHDSIVYVLLWCFLSYCIVLYYYDILFVSYYVNFYRLMVFCVLSY